MDDDPYRLRTLASAAEAHIPFDVLSDAFGEDISDDEREKDALVIEPDRDHIVEHAGDGPVANAGAYTRALTVPGGIVPAAHVTLVGVRQTHRRRGLLTRLMIEQLADIRRRGEPIALLWASEGRIYQRFGYGMAAERYSLQVDLREARMVRPPLPVAGRLRDAVPATVRKDLEQLYERVRVDRPGWSSRDENWWSWKLHDAPSGRNGYTARKALLYEGPDGLDGYALWRRKGDWGDSGPQGEVRADEVVTATPAAYQAIWHFLMSLDLARTVRYHFGAADEPLRYLVGEPRALGVRVGDSLWVRVVDVPGALAARRYATPVDLVIEVSDPLIAGNAGRWRLAGGACTPTTDPADLVCDIADLGALYLGGATVATLAAAGRVREERPGAVAEATAAFRWVRAPSALDIF